MTVLFGYMDFLIIYKWLKNWSPYEPNAPSIITTMIKYALETWRNCTNFNILVKLLRRTTTMGSGRVNFSKLYPALSTSYGHTVHSFDAFTQTINFNV
jgi:hypothetical protein